MNYFLVILTATILTFAVACSAANDTSKTSENDHMTAAASRTYAQNYKDMALAYCIAKAYSDDPQANKDATATAGGLDQWTNYDAEDGATAIPDLVKKYLSRHYASIHGEKIKLDLLKCIDMYHSKDLEKLVTKYVQKPNHSYMQDSK